MAVNINIPKPIYTANEVGAYSTSETDDLLNDKVDKETGKGLSENDFTDALKTKLDGIEAGAEVNVNADWNAVSGDALILNKPTIPDVSGLVPYTGSNADVDLGTNGIDAKFVNVKGTGGNGKLGLKHQSSNATAGGQETVIFAGSDGEPRYKNDGNAVEIIASRAWVGLQGFITNVVTALGYTPVPNTRTINGYDLTANRTLTASDVGAPSGSGTSEGTNTGDETQSSIFSKLKLNVKKGINYGAVTGTTGETLVGTLSFPANAFESSDNIRLVANVTRSGTTTSPATLRVKVNSVNDFASATTIATVATTNSSQTFFGLVRENMAISGGNLTGFPFTTSANTDVSFLNAAPSSVAIDVTQQLFFFVSIANASITESNVVRIFKVSNL